MLVVLVLPTFAFLSSSSLLVAKHVNQGEWIGASVLVQHHGRLVRVLLQVEL